MQRRDDRIDIRVSPEERALLERAAELDGRTLAGFIRHAAEAAAIRVIAEQDAQQ